MIGDQRNTVLSELSALDSLLQELHTAGLGCVDQFADHSERIEKMPGAREEQSAPDAFAQLRGRFAHRFGLPEIDGHLLLAHARQHCFDGWL
ncbi:hypothetical protein D3C84_898060 [compost metagenome]